jgi:transposase
MQPHANIVDSIAEIEAGTDARVAPAVAVDPLERIRQLESVINAQQLEIRVLIEKLRTLKARQFGASSERRADSDQVVMAFLEELKKAGDIKLAEQLAAEVLADLQDDEQDEVDVPAHQRRRAGRRALNPNLERIVQREELPAAERFCPHDGAELREIGVEVSERVHIIPAQYKVLRIERVKYACPCCDNGFKVAALAPRIIPRSIFTEESLAWIVTAKYVDGMPLFRLAKSIKRYGGDLSPNTLAETVVRLGVEVVPLVNMLRDALFDRNLIHGDETWMQVLREPGARRRPRATCGSSRAAPGRRFGCSITRPAGGWSRRRRSTRGSHPGRCS